MNSETLTALRESIAKWERNAAVENIEDTRTGPNDCPLCKLFLWDFCSGCPVSERTRQHSCIATPYHDVMASHDMTAFKLHAQAEVAFLKSLLPEESAQ